MKRIFTHLLAVLMLSLVTTSARAQTTLEDGKVYQFVNKSNTSLAMSATSATSVGGVTIKAATADDKGCYSQLWYVTKADDAYQLRNLLTGNYLVGNGKSAFWTQSADAAANATSFNLVTVGDYITLRSTAHSGNGYAYMHYASSQSGNIVGWESSADATQWTVSSIDFTQEQLSAAWENAETIIPSDNTIKEYQAALSELFTDNSCVTPKLASFDAAKATDAYNTLPAALQRMVEKVYGGDWSEETVALSERPNGNDGTHGQWDVATTWEHEYAKKFRLQMYEPYSIEGEITGYLRFNAHCNMDNPTGIYANSGEPIYIMVEGTIEDGAELWVAHQNGHGATAYYNNAAYTQLHEGLNVIPYFSDGSQLWINYVVHTYNSSGTTIEEKFPRKLSDFEPLKIHIEGGKINGFFNAMGDYRATAADGSDNLWGDVDNDEDWDYYKKRVALATDFALLGHRQTLLFDFGTWNAENGYFGVANSDGGIERALAYHLENITVPETPNCYAGSGTGFGDYSDTYYPGMNLSAESGEINIMLEAWDRIMYSEHATMGLLSEADMAKMNALYPGWASDGSPFDLYNYGSTTVAGVTQTYKEFCQGLDYGDYYNHHGAAVGSGSGYMSGGWRVCNYHYNTMESIIGKIAAEPGPTWGPAHEIGHQHQGVFNLNGQTEVTNNFFSNVAVWYMGMATSRLNSNGSLAGVLEAFNTENNDAYTNNIWALTHLYYRLWLYYHLAGNNTQFWPRLFELCRQVPLVNGSQISGETSLLRFYQHACDAAGEDLTEFFRAHGYLEVMDERLVGDYSNGTYNVTEEQIATAIETVKAKNYPVNYAILLINDGTTETTLKHDGATSRSLWDGSATADYGSVNDFIDGETSVTQAYTATVSTDGTVTMSGGEGGVGFLVFNEDGELISFSNSSTFKLSEEAAYLVATGQAEITAVDAESNTTEAKVDLTAIQAALLAELISTVEALPMETDDSYTHVGYYTTPATETLRTALATAKETAETGVGLAAAYELLYDEYKALSAADPAIVKVQFDPSLTYIITNYAYPTRTMTVVNGVVYANSGVDTSTDAAKWQFKETATSGVYNVYNCSGIYCGTISGSAAVVTTTDAASASNYTVDDLGGGLWAISLNPAGTNTQFHAASNDSYKIVGWNTNGTATKWYITAVEANSGTKVAAELQALIEKTEKLIGTLATVSDATGSELDLQSTTPTANYYISCSNPHPNGDDGEGGVAALLDNDNTTYLHTNYTEGQISQSDDYLQVYLGAGNELNRFIITGVQRSGATNDFPKDIEIQGSVDGTEDSWTTIANVTGLPTSAGSSWERYVVSLKDYAYLRFIVTTSDDRNYFHLAEFSIYKVDAAVTLLPTYSEYSTILTNSLIADAYNGVKLGKEWLNYDAATSAEIKTYTETLQAKYDALYLAYKQVIDAEKAKLETLISNTEGLIAKVGTATVIADANIDLLGKLYAESPYTAGGTGHSDYSSAENGYNLLDGKAGTHYHSDYNPSTMVSPPYIRVDLGEGNSAGKFRFNYTTRNQTGCAPTKINVYGSNEQDDNYVLLGTFTSSDSDNPLPTAAKTSWTSSDITSATAYRYFKFEVATSQGSNSGGYYFAISEFGFQRVGEVSATVNSEYVGIVTEDLLVETRLVVNASEAMVVYAGNYTVTVEQLKQQQEIQQAAYDKLNEAMSDISALKDLLDELMGDAQQLYTEIAVPSDGVVLDYFTSAITQDKLDVFILEIQQAEVVDNNASATYKEVEAAYLELKAIYDELEAVKDADYTGDRTELEELAGETEALIEEVAVISDDNAITIREEYVSPNMSVEIVAAAVQKVATALDAVNKYATEDAYKTALKELQAAKDALELAKNLVNIPVIITTDAANPVLYKIYIGRTNYDRSLLAYDASSTMVAVANLDFEKTEQNWYFMQGTDDSGYDDVLIIPYNANPLATNDFSEGNSKVKSVAKETDGYSYNWNFSEITGSEWYNIKMNDGSDTYYYFSNFGGYTQKMGFYNSSTSSDGGSMFRFVLADARSVLSDYISHITKEPEVYAPGYYSTAEAYNTAYDVASDYVANANGTEEQYITAYTNLFAAKAALVDRIPSDALENGAVYRIMNLITNTTVGYEYHYLANNAAAITFPTAPASDNSDLWVCKANEDGTYEFVSALGTATLGWVESIKETNAGAVKEDATDFVIADGTAQGSKRLVVNNYSMSLTNELWNSKGVALFNRAGNNGSAQLQNWSTDWFFQKVDDAEVGFTVKISARRFSSLYLPYDVEVPEGVSAFTAVNVDGSNVDLYRVADRYDDTAAGSVIPARTPVILYLEDEPYTAGDYTFTYASDADALSDVVAGMVDEAIIYGKILQTPILCDADTRYYKLGGKTDDTVSKMYWMYKEYGSDGTITDAGTDNGGYIRCSANKIYMKVAESLAANSFSMRFGNDSGTTGIEELKVESGEMKVIYDLTGRRVEAATAPGMYIVNGKKAYVK